MLLPAYFQSDVFVTIPQIKFIYHRVPKKPIILIIQRLNAKSLYIQIRLSRPQTSWNAISILAARQSYPVKVSILLEADDLTEVNWWKLSSIEVCRPEP